MKKFTDLHLHTDASVNDSPLKVAIAVKREAELGATAAAITDHGNCANWMPWYNECIKNEIKPILGVEAYIQTEGYYNSIPDEKLQKEIRQHLILLAKDYKGIQAISRFMTESNRNLDSSGRPVAVKKMVQDFFGSGSEGYGHVICTTACIAGPIATVLSFNHKIEREISKIEDRINKSLADLPNDFKEKSDIVERVNAEIALLQTEVDTLADKAGRTFKEMTAQIKAETDPVKKAELKALMNAQKEETKSAKERTKELKQAIRDLKGSVKEERAYLSKLSNKLDTISENRKVIETLNASKKELKVLIEEAAEEMNFYKEIFQDDFFAEVQYHGIEAEAELYPMVVSIAKSCGVKIVASNDVHIAKREDAKGRELIRNSAYISAKNAKYRPSGVGDDELYIKTSEELVEMLSQILSADEVEEAMANIEVIADQCNLPQEVEPKNGMKCFSLEKHYPQFYDADEKLRELATLGETTVSAPGVKPFSIKAPGVKGRYPVFPDEYKERLEYELSVITEMGFSSYFLFIADVISYGKHLRENALDIGPGRGSGAGSMVCYTSGITELDPMENNLLFERFLNPERVSMPDIDTDFSKYARKHCIAYVKEKYGIKSVAGIMTKGCYGAKTALTNAPKLLGLERTGNKSEYSVLGAKMRAYIDDPNKSLSAYDEVLKDAFSDNEDAMIILEYAKYLEGCIKSYGQHAAGLICIQNDDIENYIPLMAVKDEDKKDSVVIQADMVEAEGQLGFIKFDFLRLKNLNIITKAIELIKKNHGVSIDPYKIPFEDRVFQNILASGDTDFVFQLESEGMKDMLKKLKPSCFGDIVLGVSVYRPGPMDFIPDIIAAKNGEKESSMVTRIPMLKSIYAETYGYPVYQEQVMKTFSVLAGFSAGKSDEVRRHMSKKHEEELAAIRPEFIEGCKENGIKEEDSNWLFDQLMPFAKYGFNKSHAAVYSLISYMTAWLKEYYPAEYLCAAMVEQGDKTSQFVRNCKSRGFSVYRPDINESEVDYSVHENGIIVGLSAIKGLKEESVKIVEERKANGLYQSLEDFLERVSIRSNNVSALILAGAFDTFVNDRESASKYAEEYKDVYSSLQDYKNKVLSLEEQLKHTTDSTKMKSIEKSLKTATGNVKNYEEKLNSIVKPSRVMMPVTKRLAYESQLLGMWVTGNPLEDYNVSAYKKIADLEAGQSMTIAGVISDCNVIKTKKGEDMALVNITDVDGQSIKGVCFPAAFSSNKSALEDGKVVSLKGNVNEKDTEDGEDVELELFINEVTVLVAGIDPLLLEVSDIVQYKETVEPILLRHENVGGVPVSVKNIQIQELREVSFRVSRDCVEELMNAGIVLA